MPQAEAVLRDLRFGWFTTDLVMDERRGAARGRRERGRARRRARAGRRGDAEVEEAYQRDRAEARNPTRFSVKLGRTAASDGPDRYTAPSIVLRAEGRELVAPGYQPFEAVDVLVMNLVPQAERLPVPSARRPARGVPGWPDDGRGRPRARGHDGRSPTRPQAEDALIRLCVAGGARRQVARARRALDCRVAAALTQARHVRSGN